MVPVLVLHPADANFCGCCCVPAWKPVDTQQFGQVPPATAMHPVRAGEQPVDIRANTTADTKLENYRIILKVGDSFLQLELVKRSFPAGF